MQAILGSLAAPLLGKLFHLKKGGVIHTKGKNKSAVVVVHDGEMVIPKKDVSKTKEAMKHAKVKVPKRRKV